MITDEQLSALVAEKVAGWKRYGPSYGLFPPDLDPLFNVANAIPIPPYATSFDAVTPYLEKWAFVKCSRWVGGNWLVSVSNDQNEHVHKFAGYAPTLARAACLCLLRAHDVEVKL